MTSGSPTAYLLWAILSCLFLGFLVLHLWTYDRFKCVKWGAGRQPGAFKRIMTYSYLMTLPLLVTFGVAMSVIKFKEGYIQIQNHEIIPKPITFYSQANKRWLFPLSFVLSVSWSLEIVTHLEELVFWLFLIHQGPRQRDWFRSWEYRAWYLGSITAIIGLPLTALLKRNDIEASHAWIFLVGSTASLITTIFFIFVLWKFPEFLRYVKAGGADLDVVMRLTTFYQLNLIRVGFRFMFTVPFFAVALDGVQGPHRVVRNTFWSDFLFMNGAIGCFVSSAITLFIFFPRSPGGTESSISRENKDVFSKPSAQHITNPPQGQFRYPNPAMSADLTTFRFPSTYDDPPEDLSEHEAHAMARSISQEGSDAISMRESRTFSDEARYAYHRQAKVVVPLSRSKLARQQARSSRNSVLHPYVTNFTSPIDLPESSENLANPV